MQTLDYVSSLHNCLELSQPSSRLDEATHGKVLYCITSSEDLVENCLVVNSLWLHVHCFSCILKAKTHNATNHCNTSPRQVAATNLLVWHVKIVVAATEFCRCDQTGLNLCDVSQQQNKRKQPCCLVCTHLQQVAATKFQSTNEEASIYY